MLIFNSSGFRRINCGNLLCEIVERAANYSTTCMEESSHQEFADGFNVPGEPIVQQFEKKDGESESEEKTSSDVKDASQPWDSLGSRQRNPTEKGLEEQINWLKQQHVNALRAVSRKRTEVSDLMVNSNNLHLVKNELANLNDLIEHYKETFHAYYKELTDDETKD